jgi:riboflavin kinase/FMN adenylyltransferase
MQVIHISHPFQNPFEEAKVMAIGDFDGVHLGHQKVIGDAHQIARQQGVATAMMTFHPHPREILGLQKYEYLLTPFSHRIRLLEALDVDYLYIISFNESFAKLSADEFIQDVLEKLNITTVVIGFDFKFGYRGQGTAQYLTELIDKSFQVHIIEPYLQDNLKVSSTRIRQHLEFGEVAHLPQLLGRYYDMIGTVESGDGRGRSIGFPTANLQLDGTYIFPKLGVYAVRVYVNHKKWHGVMNIGTRPTFYDDAAIANVEVHLLDFSGDLYGELMRVELVDFIRSETRFAAVDQLIQQIHLDIEHARAIFNKLNA